jgi:superfamily II DNA/RNA helicase
MVKRLKEEGHSADAIHGDLRQSKRDRVITSFRKGLKRILIATDVAARGLDIPLIQHVINYDLPQVPEDYVHRIGRTARAGTEGSALTFLTPDDRSMWNEISKLIDPNFKPAPRGARGNSRGGKKGKAPYNKKRKFRDEKKSFSKGRPDRLSRNGEKKSFGYKGKSSFGDKSKPSSYGRSSSSSRNGEKKSFGYKGKSSFGDKSKPTGFTNNPKYFGKKTSESSSSGVDKKSSGFGGKKKFKSRSDRPKNFTFKKHSQKRTKA